MPVDHYENFPVASLLLPRRLRAPVEAIYAFARGADDVADEGDLTEIERLDRLAEYRDALHSIAAGGTPAKHPFATLAATVRRHDLPLQPFHDLLDAFSRDVTRKRYATFAQLLDYCRLSANPVGRLLLRLYEADNEANVSRSDAICTALQLVNFWQDVALDWTKDRIYMPYEDMQRFGVDETWIEHQRSDERWRALMAFQVERTERIMREGASLARHLPGRIGWELRLVVAGGSRVLERIATCGGDVFHARLVLGPWDWTVVAARALALRDPGAPAPARVS